MPCTRYPQQPLESHQKASLAVTLIAEPSIKHGTTAYHSTSSCVFLYHAIATAMQVSTECLGFDIIVQLVVHVMPY